MKAHYKMRVLIFTLALLVSGRVWAVEIYGLSDSQKLEDQYLVIMKKGASLALRGSDKELGVVKKVYQRVFSGYHITANQQQIESWLANPEVAHIEVNTIYTINEEQTSNAPWGLDRIDSRSGRDNTYTYTRTGKGVHAYIIDTGVRISHNEFEGRTGKGYSALNDRHGENDCNGHGTHVAGIIGSKTYGVAKAVTIHGVRVLDCKGSGELADIISGIEWVLQNAELPAVVNMSLGGKRSPALDEAVRRGIDLGIPFVVAAGNDRRDACNYSPANIQEAITVGSTNQKDERSGFSNYGLCVDIFAPGSSIKSLWKSNDRSTKTISGTSMASPHVAGVVALHLEEDANYSPSELSREIVKYASFGKVLNPGLGSNNRFLFSNPNDESPQDPPPEAEPSPNPDPSPPGSNPCSDNCDYYSAFLETNSKVILPSSAGFLVSNKAVLKGFVMFAKSGRYQIRLERYRSRPPGSGWVNAKGVTFEELEYFLEASSSPNKRYRWVIESFGASSQIHFWMNNP